MATQPKPQVLSTAELSLQLSALEMYKKALQRQIYVERDVDVKQIRERQQQAVDALIIKTRQLSLEV